MADLVIRGATDRRRAGQRSEPRRPRGQGRPHRRHRRDQGRGRRRRSTPAGWCSSPGIVDVHTHYDAQVTWDATLSPSPSLGVTTAVMGNCGFGIVPAPPAARDLVIRNLSVVEGMDLDALRTGINWDFESFSDYMAMLRRRGAYANLAVLAGHSTIRTAVMGEAASQRKDATPEELAQHEGDGGRRHGQGRDRARRLLFAQPFGLWRRADAVDHRADVGARRAGRRHGPARPRRDRDRLGREDAAGAGADGRQARPAVFPGHRHGDVQRAGARRARIEIFDDCAAAIRRGNGLYIQIPCQPLSFDFTMANAYPFYSHSAFDPIKAYTPEQLKAVFRDPSWRAKFRENAKNPRPGMIFQGNWDRVMVAVAHKPANAKYVNRYAAEIAETEHRDPLDVMLDLSLDEDLETAFLGRFLNVGDDGVARLLKHEAGVVALSDAGAHLIYMCDAGFGLHFLARWVRERGDFDIVEGIRRLTSHPADLYGIQNRGRIAVGAQADLLLFDPADGGRRRRPSASPTCRAAAAAPSAGRPACTACSATAS